MYVVYVRQHYFTFYTFSLQITGYLNLLANSIDNFTHGLSLGGAFLVSLRLGLLTTFAILIHEIPHEVGDFAILLKSGFTRWDAAVFQILTAGGGLIGAMAAIMCSGATTSIGKFFLLLQCFSKIFTCTLINNIKINHFHPTLSF